MPATCENYTDEPVYWFVRLEQAKAESDFESAIEAQRQLERLGVRVTFPRRTEQQEGHRNA